MSITKIVNNPVDTEYALENLCNYITAPEKTGDGVFVGARGISKETAFEEIVDMQQLYQKTSGRRAYHLIVSFEEGAILTLQDVQEIAFDISDLFFPEYQVLYGVHITQGYLHIHFAINPVSMITGKKLQLDFTAYHWLQQQINQIQAEYEE